jgi:DNA-binding Lrp family transcriptional regulator
MSYPAQSSALMLINIGSSTKAGAAGMSGNVEEVDRKLRAAANGHIDLIHWLVGPNDMVVHVHAKTLKELLRVIEDRVLPLKNDVHNKIISTETMIVTRSKARDTFVLSDSKPKKLNAWVFTNTNSNDPELGFRLMEDKNVVFVSHVIGRFDMALLIRASTMQDLQSTIDQRLRTKNYFASTDTRIVLG